MIATGADVDRLVESYMALPYRIEFTPDLEDGGYLVTIPDLPGCISQGDTIDEAAEMIRDAQRSWLMSALRYGDAIPRPSAEKAYNGRVMLRMPPFLHESVVRDAQREGVSVNQYVTAILARGNTVNQLRRDFERGFAYMHIGIGAIHAHLREHRFKDLPVAEVERQGDARYAAAAIQGRSVAA